MFDTAFKYKEMSNIVFGWVTILLCSIVIVIPNSLRILSFPLFLAAGFLALTYVKKTTANFKIFFIWLCSCIVTLIYAAVGVEKGFVDAFWQTIFVYIVSPALWLIISLRIIYYFSLPVIIRILIMFGILGAMSVFLYYFIFIKFGAEYLTWMISDPNIQYDDQVIKASMHVFGSMMFIYGGFFAAPQMVKGRFIRICVILVYLAAVILSGRSALMLSVAIGVTLFACNNFRNASKINFTKTVKLFVFSTIFLGIVLIIANLFNVDLFKIISDLLEKISQGGGEERQDQAVSLWNGIKNSWMLGAGHGVGVDVVRNDDYPWRYELLWLSTLFKVGIIGTIVYSVPAIIILLNYFNLVIQRKNSIFCDFIFAGFVSSFIGTATNPYYESFDFQWMFAFPFVYFMLRRGYLASKIDRQTYV